MNSYKKNPFLKEKKSPETPPNSRWSKLEIGKEEVKDTFRRNDDNAMFNRRENDNKFSRGGYQGYSKFMNYVRPKTPPPPPTFNLEDRQDEFPPLGAS
mgnify:CR=1 FL=1